MGETVGVKEKVRELARVALASVCWSLKWAGNRFY